MTLKCLNCKIEYDDIYDFMENGPNVFNYDPDVGIEGLIEDCDWYCSE